MWNCTHFRYPTDEQLRHVDIYFLATKIIWSLSTLNIHVKCPFSFPQRAILDILEQLLWWVLGHEKFCYHLLLLLEICLLLWATLLFMEERSIHRLILQYFATVSNYSVTFVTDDFIFAKMERITKLLDTNVSQLR